MCVAMEVGMGGEVASYGKRSLLAGSAVAGRKVVVGSV